MGRRKMRGIFTSRLHLRANFHRKRDVWRQLQLMLDLGWWVDLEQLSQLSANWFLVGFGGDQIHRQFKLSLGPEEVGISHENLGSEKQLYNDQTKQRPPARQAGAYPIVGANRAAVSSWGHRNVGALISSVLWLFMSKLRALYVSHQPYPGYVWGRTWGPHEDSTL